MITLLTSLIFTTTIKSHELGLQFHQETHDSQNNTLYSHLFGGEVIHIDIPESYHELKRAKQDKYRLRERQIFDF